MNTQVFFDTIYRNQYSATGVLSGSFGERLITYADYVASGQPLKCIEEFITRNVFPTYANTHTEASYSGLQTSKFREEARAIIKKSVNASDEDCVIFCGSGSTAAIDKLYRKLSRQYRTLSEKPVILLGPYEHHSNILPWREGGFDVVDIPLSATGNIDVEFLQATLEEYRGKREMIGSFSAASNVTGILAPVKKITELLKANGALSFWDYAAGAPYLPIDMNPSESAKIDAIFISAHKFLGGPGTPGILVVKKHLFDNTVPVVAGGGTVELVTKSMQMYHQNIEVREEGGTPAILESIRAGLAFKLKDTVGAKVIEEREKSYISRAFAIFSANENIHILGSLTEPRLGFFSFLIRSHGRYLHYNFVVALLNDLFGIQSRGGCSCAGPYGQELLGIEDNQYLCQFFPELLAGNHGIKPGWSRISFNYFIPEEEFQYLLSAIEWIANDGWKLLKLYRFDEARSLWHYIGEVDYNFLSLDSFLNDLPAEKGIDFDEKERLRKSYFEFADELAQKAIQEWGNTPTQNYVFSPINNELRWFTLADDVIIS